MSHKWHGRLREPVVWTATVQDILAKVNRANTALAALHESCCSLSSSVPEPCSDMLSGAKYQGGSADSGAAVGATAGRSGRGQGARSPVRSGFPSARREGWGQRVGQDVPAP